MTLPESRRAAYLDALGITRWVLRRPVGVDRATVADGAAETAPDEPQGQSPAVGQALDWDGLARAVAECRRCALHETRTQTVFGVGDRAAACFVVGEAPGEQEDLAGEPFVGRAGLLLNNMLRAIGLARDQVYIANVLKCRPPRNRDPSPAEAEACLGYLLRQIELVQPRVLLLVGRIAAQHLLRTDAPVGRLRGMVHRLPGSGTPLVVTYHPAYLLRRPEDKGKAWEDLKLVLKVLRDERGT